MPRQIMHPCNRFAAAILVFAGVALLGQHPPADASWATAQSDTLGVGGVTHDAVAAACGAHLPRLADLRLVRIGVDPGAGMPFDPADPAQGVLLVEAGTVTLAVDADVTVSRGGLAPDAAATACTPTGTSRQAITETVAAGEKVTLHAGDSALIPGGVAGELRNFGSWPAVAIGVLIGAAGSGAAESPPAAPSPTPVFIESTTP